MGANVLSPPYLTTNLQSLQYWIIQLYTQIIFKMSTQLENLVPFLDSYGGRIFYLQTINDFLPLVGYYIENPKKNVVVLLL